MSYCKTVERCVKLIKNEVKNTPLQYSSRLSYKYNCNVYLKREDLQNTRSFKIRGATNKIKNLYNKNELRNGITCASAGNHAQGVAYICNKLKINGTIFLPKTTPLQKINRIEYFGGQYINIIKHSNTVDNCLEKSKEIANENDLCFVHPFDDLDIIDGQATVGLEIMNKFNPDIVLCPVGGGGLISGVSKYMKSINDSINIIGVEPLGACSLYNSINNNKITTFNNIDTFVDGASIAKIGNKTFDICKQNINHIELISNEHLCYNLIEIYQNDGIILEPAGALSIAALDNLNDKQNIEGKNIVCILSGGNNDLTRYDEIMDLSLKYQNLKHYFIVEFSQSPGQLKMFINNILGKNDDIIRFEYLKKTNRDYGKVLIGIELKYKEDLKNIVYNLEKYNFKYSKVEKSDLI